MTPVYIHDIAAFLPGEPISNDRMEAVLGQAGPRPSRARRTTLRSNGIHQRHYCIDPVTGKTTYTNAQLTAEAVRQLGADFQLEDLDCLVCGTTMPDQLMPGHAVMVHGELGNPPCEVVTTAGVCVAGVTALKYAWQAVACGEHQNAIATGSETASAIMRGRFFEPEVNSRVEALAHHPEIAFEKDFLRWMLSDGAGAMLLRPAPRQDGHSLRLNWIELHSYANEMATCMYAGAEKLADGRLKGWKEFAPEEWLERSVHSIKQDVKQLNEHIIHYTVERPLQKIMQRRELHPEQIDWFIPHYSSEYFRHRVAEGLSRSGFAIPFERWFTNLAERGNTGSASIYIMLADLFHNNRLRAGQQLLCWVPESGRFTGSFMHMTVCAPDQV